jgi:hypothetical protein
MQFIKGTTINGTTVGGGSSNSTNALCPRMLRTVAFKYVAVPIGAPIGAPIVVSAAVPTAVPTAVLSVATAAIAAAALSFLPTTQVTRWLVLKVKRRLHRPQAQLCTAGPRKFEGNFNTRIRCMGARQQTAFISLLLLSCSCCIAMSKLTCTRGILTPNTDRLCACHNSHRGSMFKASTTS